MMIIRSAILLFLVSAIGSAQSLVFESYPGCFTGPRRSTIVASPESAPALYFYNGEGTKADPVNVGTANQSKVVIDQLIALELSKEEIKMIQDRDTLTGPNSYELKMALGDRTWKVSYPAFLVNLTPKQKKIMKYDDTFLTVIGKLEKIHKIVSGLIPKDAK